MGTESGESGTSHGVGAYDERMAVDLIDLPPDLRHAVEQARRAIAEERRATAPLSGRLGSWLTDDEREAVRAAVATGAYAAAVAAVVANEPDLASD